MNHQHPSGNTIRISVSGRKVTASLGDTVLAESTATLVLDEQGYPPRYYFPKIDVRMKLLKASDKSTMCPHKGHADYFNIEVDGEVKENAAWSYLAPRLAVAEISGCISFCNDDTGIRVD